MMLSGEYFFFDPESSTTGYQLFRYKKITTGDRAPLDWQEIPASYPLYLVLEPQRITFFLSTQSKPDNDEAGAASLYHIKILNLPLSEWGNYLDDLSRRLRTLFGETESLNDYNLKISHNYKEYKRMPEAESKKQIDKSGGIEPDTQPENEHFINPYEELWINLSPGKVEPLDKPGDRELVKRELFLDFIFDFTHSEVFKLSRNYVEVEQKINSHFLFNAIRKKCEYYFYRNNYSELNQQKKGRGTADLPIPPDENVKLLLSRKLRYIAEELWKAEENWLQVLKNENALLLYKTSGWFNTSKVELDAVLIDDRYHVYSHTNQHFLQRALNYFHHIGERIGKAFHPGHPRFSRPDWLRSMLDGKEASPMVVFDQKENIKNSVNKIFPELMRQLFITSAYFLFFYSHRILFKGLTIFCVTVFILFFIGVETQCNITKVILGIALIAGPVLMIFLPLLTAPLALRYRKTNIMPLHYHASMALPNMSLSVIAAWMAYVPVSEEAWSMNVGFSPTILAMAWALTFFFTWSITATTIRNLSPETTIIDSYMRGLVVYSMGLSFSICCGILTMHILKEKPLSKAAEYLPHEMNTERIDSMSLKKDHIESLIHEIQRHVEKQQDTMDLDAFTCARMEILLKDKLSDKYFSKYYNNYIERHPRLLLIDYAKVKDLKTDIDSCWSKLNTYISDNREALILDLAENHANESYIPSIAVIKINFFKVKKNIFVFPRLLIVYSAFAFFLGFFVEVAFLSRAYKEPV